MGEEGRGCLSATLPPQLFLCQGLPEWLGSDQASAKERTHSIAPKAAFPHRWTSHIKSLGALICEDNPPFAAADPHAACSSIPLAILKLRVGCWKMTGQAGLARRGTSWPTLGKCADPAIVAPMATQLVLVLCFRNGPSFLCLAATPAEPFCVSVSPVTVSMSSKFKAAFNAPWQCFPCPPSMGPFSNRAP